jgi:predicted PurR-regulated permease PerM
MTPESDDEHRSPLQSALPWTPSVLANVMGRDQRRVLWGLSARAWFLTITGVSTVAILVAFRAVLFPFWLALLIAYVLAPLVDALERIPMAPMGRGRLPRWVAVLVLYVALISLLVMAGVFAAPRFVLEVEKLLGEAPKIVSSVRDTWFPELERSLQRMLQPYMSKKDVGSTLSDVLRRATELDEGYAVKVLGIIRAVVFGVVQGTFTLAMTLMVSAYLLITSKQILNFFRTLVRPERQARFSYLVQRLDRGLSGVVRGQLMICVVNGVLSGIGFAMFQLKYWPILTLIATVLSIIPIFGAIISTIPATVVALQQSVGTAVLVLIWTVAIHQLEANVFNPKIMGDVAKVHPVLVVFALLAGESVFGIAGALFAVPVLSVVQTLFLHYREVSLGVPASTTTRPPPELDLSILEFKDPSQDS